MLRRILLLFVTLICCTSAIAEVPSVRLGEQFLIPRQLHRKSYLSADDVRIHKGKIVWLSLYNSVIQQEALDLLSQIPSVRYVTFEDVNVGDRDIALFLANAANCEYLNLRGSDVTDLSISALAQAKPLKYVELTNTAISEGGIKKLKELRPEMEIKF